MDNFEKLLYQVKETLESATKAVAQKSGDLVNLTKIKYEIGAEQSALDNLYNQIGMAVYALKKSQGETDKIEENINRLCDEVSAKLDKINAMKTELAKMKNNRLCPNCGKINDAEATFCNNCGTQLSEEDVVNSDFVEVDDD